MNLQWSVNTMYTNSVINLHSTCNKFMQWFNTANKGKRPISTLFECTKYNIHYFQHIVYYKFLKSHSNDNKTQYFNFGAQPPGIRIPDIMLQFKLHRAIMDGAEVSQPDLLPTQSGFIFYFVYCKIAYSNLRVREKITLWFNDSDTGE